jgi:predicted  nucleic acid-binding Zn-ribbon protein
MEMKYNRDRMYTCENCGRILITEDVADEVEAAVEEGNV